ncbi:MAG: hypothetical protein QM831_29515 [Kofleriaceae bacterium]
MFPRFIGLFDIVVVVVIVVIAVLPPRAQYTVPAIKADDTTQFAIALAEARTIARPGDGAAIDELTHKLDEAGQKDWAIDFSVLASDRTKDSPTRWRALVAVSTAYVDRFDVAPGLDYANRALSACDQHPEACSPADKVRLELIQQNLDAGVKSGIDPRKDRRGFMKAGEKALMQIHIERQDKDRTKAEQGSAQGSATAP